MKLSDQVLEYKGLPMKIYRYTYEGILLVAILVCFAFARPDLKLVKIGSMGQDNGSVRIGVDGFELNGAVSGFTEFSDNVLYAFGTPSGNFDLRARVFDPVDQNKKSEAGLMIRADTAAVSGFISFLLVQERGTFIKYRTGEGKKLKTVLISNNIYPWLRIVRNGNSYSFYFKNNSDNEWNAVQVNYEFNFPFTVCAGVIHASNSESSSSISNFSSINGIPQEIIPPLQCQPIVFDFEDGKPFDSLGFSNVHYWNLDPGHYIRTATNGGSLQHAQFITAPFTMNISDDTTNISWDFYPEDNGVPLLTDYTLFATEGISVLDRSVLAGGDIGSPGQIQIGIDARVSGNIFSGKDILLWDRSGITGNVTASDTVKLYSNAWVQGSISEHQATIFPTIPTKSVLVGSNSIYVNPGDSMDISPGQYNILQAFANTKLRFRPGVYSFSRLIIDTDVRMHMNADANSTIEINVRDSFALGDRTQMIVADTNSYKNISIYSHQSNIVTFGTDEKLFGYFYFPRAETIVPSRTILINGGIYTRKMTVQPDVGITINRLKGTIDTLITEINTSGDSTDDYSIIFLIHRNKSLDTLTDLFVNRNGALVVSYKSLKPTPVQKWLTLTAQFFNNSSSPQMRLLYDNGTGTRKILDSIALQVNNFNSLAFDYKTPVTPNNRQIRIDNISISCSQYCHKLLIERQLVPDTVYKGGTAHFACSINTGSDHVVYQWYRNNKPVAWINTPEYSIQNVEDADNGSLIYCKISGSCDTITTDTVSLLVLNCNDLSITYSPRCTTVTVNQSANFEVFATGHDLTYQWYWNDKKIENATGRAYRITTVQNNNNLDEFKVQVTNGCNENLMSDSAVLHVQGIAPCKFTLQPRGDTLQEGDYYVGVVDAFCEASSFQWFKNGIPIPNAIAKELILGPVSLADNRSVLTCVVSNGSAADTSDNAILNVIVPRPGNRIIAISGELVDGNNKKQGADTVKTFDFRVCLFTEKTGGTSFYTEYFTGKRAVIVRDGEFTVNLGRGEASESNLQKILAGKKQTYAELSAGHFSNYEIIGARIPLSAAPYAMSSGVKIIYGDGSPVTANVIAPVGTVYLDKIDNYRMWKKLNNSWVKID